MKVINFKEISVLCHIRDEVEIYLIEEYIYKGGALLSDQPYMNFEVRENVKHLKDGQSFRELSSLELEPIIKVKDTSKGIDISGYLVLTGEFLKGDKNWEEQFEQSDGIHYHSFSGHEGEVDIFQHQIPISFQIQPNRVKSISDVFLYVEHFDYDVISDSDIDLIANLRLLGVHPDPKQDITVEREYNFFNDEIPIKDEDGIVRGSEKEETDVNHFIEASQLEEQESLSNQNNAFEEENNVDVQNREITVEDDEGKHSELEAEEQSDNSDVPEMEDEETIGSNEEVDDTTAKVKIGIKGNRKDRKEGENQETPNPLYSLLRKNNNKDQQETEGQVIEEKVTDPEIMMNEDNNTVVSMENYVKENKMSDQDQHQHQEQYEEETNTSDVEEASTDVSKGEGETKDILFSLLNGNEENKYRLKIYFVKKEDTLDSIARRYSIKTEEIIKQNNLENRELETGQFLYLPQKG